jgi:hypothetical protein
VRLDRFSEEDFASSTIPDGENEMAITKVKDIVSKKGEAWCIVTFRDTNDSYNEVDLWFTDSKKAHQRLSMSLNESLGRPWNAELDDLLVGQVLVVKTRRAAMLDRDGNQRVFIDGFLPATTPVAAPAAKAPPKRTPTQKADAASGASSDDIPF